MLECTQFVNLFCVSRSNSKVRLEQRITIKEMAEEERPYEKCERFGTSSLTEVELLAIILRSGTKGTNSMELARKLLYSDTEDKSEKNTYLQCWTKEKLMKIHGIGKVKALQILCLCELSKRMSQKAVEEALDFSKPETIANYYMEDMRYRRQEYLKLLMLNSKLKLIAETEISKGTVNQTLVSPREIFLEALHNGAVYIILMHNHPSGEIEPSEDDIIVTRRIQNAGNILGIELLDHIIIGDHFYYSMAESGILKSA